MNTETKRWTYGAIGALTGLAGAVLLIATVVATGPFGNGVGSVMGAGFVFGLLGCGLKQIVARRAAIKLVAQRGRRRANATAIATPLLIDATASGAETLRRAGFAPVTSLTEIQALRERAARRRERERATRTGA
jgi:hypothetical protein